MPTLRHVPSPGSPHQVLRLARRRGSITRREVSEAGIHTHTLSRLVRAGVLERVARGRYRRPDAPITEHHGLALVAAAAPKAVICLLSALSFHQIGTQLPHEVWIAIDRRARRPSLPYPRLRVARFSGHALVDGIETYRLEGVDVRVYSAAKTVADCFKYRNKVGIDVAVEALRDFSRRHRGGATELARFARICRVSRVMQPYLDAIA
jgi:predicted transcriptional regulator of viral defense system